MRTVCSQKAIRDLRDREKVLRKEFEFDLVDQKSQFETQIDQLHLEIADLQAENEKLFSKIKELESKQEQVRLVQLEEEKHLDSKREFQVAFSDQNITLARFKYQIQVYLKVQGDKL